MTQTQPHPHVGQIWKEMDPRLERYIRILEVREEDIKFQTVLRLEDNIDDWGVCPRSRKESWASAARFNGKRGGYHFVEGAST